MTTSYFRHYILWTFLIIVFPSTLLSQSKLAWVDGIVLEYGSDLPVSGATVLIDRTDLGTASDSVGQFLIPIDHAGEINLRISRIGFNSIEKKLTVIPGDTVTIELRMQSTLTEIRGMAVSGSRINSPTKDKSVPISYVTRAEFSGQSFSSTAELLREEPGVLVQKTTHGHGSPIVRGLIGKYVLLLYDGIRLNRPTFRFGANQYMNSFDQNWLNSIAITRGPASVLYGSDAMGGAINMVSYSPGFSATKTKHEADLTLKYSSIDNGSTSSGRFEVVGKKLSGWTGFTYKKIGDLKGGGHIGLQSPSGWDEINFIAQTNYLYKHNKIDLQYLMSRQNQVPRYDRYVSGKFEKYIYDPQDRKMVILSLQNLDGEGRKSASRISLSYSSEDEGQHERRTGSDRDLHSHQNITTWGGFGQLSIVPQADQRLTIGTEFYHDKVTGSRFSVIGVDSTTERPAYPDGSTYQSFGLYLEYARPFWHHWEFTSGIRFSRINLKTNLELPFGFQDELYPNLTGTISVIHTISEQVNLLGRWSRGFRAPSLNDLATLGTSASGEVDVPSPGLTPETSDNYELGLRTNSYDFSGAVYLYYSRLHNLIDRRLGTYGGLTFWDENSNSIQDENEPIVYQKENVGEAEIYGLEFDATWQIHHNLKFKTNLFYTRGENLTDNKPLSRIPPLMGTFSLKRTFPKSSWIEILVRSATDQRRLSQRDIDDSRIVPGGTDGWGTLNLRASTIWQNARVTLSLQNLTDKAYKEHGSGIYSPGRGINLAVNYKFD